MPSVITKISDGCGIITVNRPDAMNALDSDTVEALRNAFLQFRSKSGVGVVILTGEGQKAFIAGADVQEMLPLDSHGAVEFARKGQDLTLVIESFPRPVIAAINGYALGGGCEVALACHIRIASEKARFGQPEVNLGIIPGWGGTQRLPRVVGPGKAIEMITTGELMSARDALRIGLVNEVVPPQDVMPTALKIGESILKRGPEAVRLSLEAIRRGLDTPLHQGLEYEADLFGAAFATRDKEEGIRAFLEKRTPEFRGS
ncbi:MAG: enoyl-CoA hydratase/isomerase family protein [Fidelibacterota bacterium]